jgi:Predicted membrane protein (DUF2207)
MRPRIVALLSTLLVVLLLVVSTTPATLAQQRSVTWDRYDVALDIASDGSVAATETQTIRFQGTYQQGFRVIPTNRLDSIDNVTLSEISNGQTVGYRRSDAQATNAYRTSSTDQGLRIDWWFAPTTDASRTFVISYRLRGALRIYDAGDQLQWKAIYADRPGPIAASTVTVHLPADVPADQLKTSFSRYTQDQDSQLGALPSNGSGQQVDPRTVRFDIGALSTGTGAETRVQFPHGLVSASPPAWQAAADRADWVQQTLAPIGAFVALLLTLGILAGGGVILFLTWYTRGRDPDAGSVPARLDQPPSDLPAPVAGTLVDGVADAQDAVATLVDLAQRGVLTMTDVDNPRLMGSAHDVKVALREAVDLPGVRPYERTLLAALFGQSAAPGAEALMSEVRGRFAASIPLLQQALHRAVADSGLFVANPEQVRARYRGLGWVLVGLGLVGAVLGALALGWAVGIAWLPGLALAIIGLACVRLARGMPRRTPAGALEAARWRAFRAHLAEPRSTEVASHPDWLPYAVAFGTDRAFLRRLESIGAPPPAWYGHPAGSGWGVPGGVIVLPGGFGGGGYGPHGHRPAPGGQGSPDTGGWQGPGVPSPQGWSDVLAEVLNGASDALASGGGSGGWSGGGFGGGGGGGGGSGGFN